MFTINLSDFEGPLDLLLFFIKRDELDIYDIPISKITREFTDYFHIMQKLDLEVAGDFILMASTLMQIKVRMLLPREVDAKGEEIDPREDLVRALLEYKRYKEASEELVILEANQRKINYRGYYDEDEAETPPEFDTLLKNITIYDLIKAFKAALMEKPKEIVHQIIKVSVSIDDQVQVINGLLENKNEFYFLELIKDMHDKIVIIVTFVALLEMIKMGRLGLKESPNFNDFIIYGIEVSGSDI
ncbi:MAG: segregation/condensation protein A [Melioribacteraceae bacterium]|nr:segregation/condensation protein A [Melioribacteraceae bacterium]